MEKDEITNDVEVEQQDDTVEVEEVEESAETIETEEDALAKAQAEAAKYRRLFEKSQKKPAPEQTQTQATPFDMEAKILEATGLHEELIEELKIRAPKYGGSLIKAQKDPKYVAVKEQFERAQKSSAASLGASRGSGSVKVKESFNTPNLDREKHRKLAMEAIQ